MMYRGCTLAVCCGCLLLALACQPDPPAQHKARPAKAELRIDDVGRMLQDNNVDWFAASDGRWVTFPRSDDTAWLAALTALRGVGLQLQSDGDAIAVSRDTHLLTRIVPPDRGWLVLIIDDLGFRTDRARRIIELGEPVFMAILPGRPHASSIARMAVAAGLPVLLHQPMEPRGYPDANPGVRAMLRGQSVEDWRAQLEDNLDGLPGVVGLNNHMGSELSRDAEAARVIAEVARERNLLVVDSLTASNSRIFAACRAVSMRCLRRDVFLDNERTDTAVMNQARLWLERAEKRGFSVAIGHPYEVTIDVLGNLMTDIMQRRLRLVGLEHVDAWLKRNGTQ